MNTFIGLELQDKYPIPKEYMNIAVYCRVLWDYTKAFYYDKDYKLLCVVEKIN